MKSIKINLFLPILPAYKQLIGWRLHVLKSNIGCTNDEMTKTPRLSPRVNIVYFLI